MVLTIGSLAMSGTLNDASVGVAMAVFSLLYVRVAERHITWAPEALYRLPAIPDLAFGACER